MDTNAERSIIINDCNNWYYFVYVNNGCEFDCDVDCKDVHEAIENLEKYIKTTYSNDDVIDNSYFFNRMFAFDGLDACSVLDVINSDEISHGAIQGDLTTMYFICDTDTIKGVKNNE